MVAELARIPRPAVDDHGRYRTCLEHGWILHHAGGVRTESSAAGVATDRHLRDECG